MQVDIIKGKDGAGGHYKRCGMLQEDIISVKSRYGAEAGHYRIEGWCTIRTSPNCVCDCLNNIICAMFFFLCTLFLPT